MLYAPSGDDATALPEQIRRDTMALNIPHAHSDAAGILTVSIGSATAEPDTQAQPRGLDPKRRRSAVSREASSAATACSTSTRPSRTRRPARSRSSPSNSGDRQRMAGVPQNAGAICGLHARRPMQYSRRSAGARLASLPAHLEGRNATRSNPYWNRGFFAAAGCSRRSSSACCSRSSRCSSSS